MTCGTTATVTGRRGTHYRVASAGGAARTGGVIAGGQLRLGSGAHGEVAQEAVGDAVNPAMDAQLLAARPCLANDRGVADVDHLLDHVQLAQPVVPLAIAVEPG